MKAMPQSQLARSGVVGSTVVKIGFEKLKTKAKRRFLSNEKSSDAKMEQEDAEAEILFKAITQLRGTAVKLAQVLGMETDVLPERIRRELAKSYHQVPPLNRVLVAKVLQQELGDRPEKLFDSFNPVAIAAASLGQVHRAELADGTAVAVKVQYPGIHLTIQSDLKLLRKIAPGGIKMLPKPMQPSREVLENSIAEVGARLQEETDYKLEASNTRWFAEHIKIDGVFVPEVFDAYCSDRVITTELLDGLHLDDWLATNPSQTARNLAAQRMNNVFVHSTLNLRRMHSDPNPGNYLFRDDGTIGLIDFGCVKHFSDQFVDHLPDLLRGFCDGDINKILADYKAIGIKMSADENFDFESLLTDFGDWLAEPFLSSSYDFKKHSDYTSRGLDLMHQLSEMPTIEKIQEDFIFYERTAYGLFKVYERLQATVDLRAGWGLPRLDRVGV